MSIDCTSCLSTIRQPDSAWYAGTKHSIMISHICGTCVSLIPADKRTPTSELHGLNITFGPVKAEIGSYGKYQCCGSRQSTPIFYTNTQAIIDHLPFADIFLNNLYPYYCTEEYSREMMGEFYKKGGRKNTEAYQWIIGKLLTYGGPIGCWLNVPVTPGGSMETVKEGEKTTMQLKLNVTKAEAEILLRKLEEITA